MATLEEWKNDFKGYISELSMPMDDYKGIMEYIDEVPNETRWIPVSERLPEIHQDVILFLRSLDIEVGFRAETEPYFYCHGADGCYIEPQNVLAWQPLPEPYNAESEYKE